MTEERANRKLVAILSADVKGYSRLMREDEEATVRTLEDYRGLMGEIIVKFRGRVVDAPGDNLLAEFASVVDAVEAAVKIQHGLEARNEELPENRRMQYRIGINLGDVIEEGERIYGDGVNIAARIEGLAEPGGLCLSSTAFEQVKSKLKLGFEYLGEHLVKNIDEPVRVYRVHMKPDAAGKGFGESKDRGKTGSRIIVGAVVIILIAGGIWRVFLHDRAPKIETASVEKMAFPLPAKPSIAVLPFTNMSGDPEQEYFSDGTAEDLITDLSKLHGLMVIARNSSFAYKGKPVPIKQIAEELGVRYLLKGSVRKAEEQVRINAQLIDATTGRHLWAERYDRKLEDIFMLQDEVTERIVEALALKLIPLEKERIIQKETNSPEAHDLVLRAWAYFRLFSRGTNSQAKKMFEKAIELDPTYAEAYVGLVWTKMIELQLGWNRDPTIMEEAFALAQKSVALNKDAPKTHVLLGTVHLWKKKHDEAIAEFEEAIALDPNNADALQALASALNFSGKSDEAIGLLKKAIRLNPHYPEWYIFNLGRAYFQAGLYEKAIPSLEEAILKNPNLPPIQYYLAASYGHLGMQAEARDRVEEIKTLRPNFLSEIEKEKAFYKHEKESECLVKGLRKAGLI